MPLYFAYGSNLDNAQMIDRCPSASFKCIARLPGYKLAFTRKSITRNCGVADALPVIGNDLWGVIYVISDVDLAELDRNEGYKGNGDPNNSYNRKSCTVQGIFDVKEVPINIETYFAVPQTNPPLPNQKYKQLIIDGARNWQLPYEYIKKLEIIEVQE